MNKAILLSHDGYEALYINGLKVKDGKPINQGYSRTKIFSKLSKTYDFDLEQMEEYNMYSDDDGDFNVLFFDTLKEYNMDF